LAEGVRVRESVGWKGDWQDANVAVVSAIDRRVRMVFMMNDGEKFSEVVDAGI